MKFEDAYNRLEVILDKMNTGKLSLEDAIKFYEEADLLIQSCQKQLKEAEKKIEIMVKNRQGQLILDETGSPIIEPFNV